MGSNDLGAIAREMVAPGQGILAADEPYARALQDAPIKTWKGDAANKQKAQEAFLHRAKLVSMARQGEYKSDMEEAA
jgi:fructose-bisphosphate aldolase class 1